MSGWSILITIVVVAVIAIVVVARLYRKASREVSLIRTGLGGQRVIMAGGAIALPYFHEIAEVNMRSLRLEVTRSGEESLITGDRLRVDIGASFSLAVEADEAAVARAAQTLGDRTFNPDRLREIVEGRFIDALRAVAAQMTLDELHEGRADFVRQVRELVHDDLAENGLRLQSVSLTALDQTPFDALDENNAFNAVGMRKLAEVIANARKERAQIDADADVAVQLSLVEANRRKLDIERSEEEARIDQQRELESMRAAQSAEIARRRAESERDAEAAKIAKEHDVRAAQIEREQQTRLAEIKRDEAMEAEENAKQHKLHMARLERERAARLAEIQRDGAMQAEEIAKERDLQIEQMQRMVAVAEKSREESKAQAEADAARAKAVMATESIATSREVASAERERELAVLKARMAAEADAARVTTAAAAERQAALDHAEATTTAARAEADAERDRADANRTALLAEAEGQRALAAAENEMADRVVAMREEMARLETLPKALAEMVRPAERIDSIRIHHVSGLGNGGGTSGGGGGSKAPVSQALDSMLEMAVQLPALKKLGDQIGVSMDENLLSAGKGQGSEAPSTNDEPASDAASDAKDS